jgi:hypothetical protein
VRSKRKVMCLSSSSQTASTVADLHFSHDEKWACCDASRGIQSIKKATHGSSSKCSMVRNLLFVVWSTARGRPRIKESSSTRRATASTVDMNVVR